MTVLSSLIPARFLTITGHLVLTIMLLWSRVGGFAHSSGHYGAAPPFSLSQAVNVEAGLPLQYTNDEYDRLDTRFVVALILTIVCLVIEYFGLFGGISTFMPTAALFSTICHGAGCVTLLLFIIDSWDADYFWIIFALLTALPAFVETCVFVGVFAFHKRV